MAPTTFATHPIPHVFAGSATPAVNSEQSRTVSGVLNEIKPDSFADEGERSKVLLAAYDLISRLETPWEFVARICIGHPSVLAALKVCQDLSLFSKWHDKSDSEMTAQALADLVNCDVDLLARLLRHLTANNILRSPTPDHFTPTPLSLSFNKPVFSAWITHVYDAVLPCTIATPTFFAETGYHDPVDSANGIFQHAKGGFKGDLFEYYKGNPREGETFNRVMGGVMAGQAPWVDIWPHHERVVLEEIVAKGPLFVDVGGNLGHDLERFRVLYPETATRLYLEDLPEVVVRSECPPAVNKVEYDFFKEQPIKGARIYYMHGILHDWSDPRALEILRNQAAAMKPGYSSLLIHDHVTADDSVLHPHATAYDIAMMFIVAGKERSETCWRELLKQAGLEVVKVWRSQKAVQGIVECRVPTEMN